MEQKRFTLDNVYSVNFISNQEIEITYFGELYQNSSKCCQIVYGFGDKWYNTTTRDMKVVNNGFVINIELEDFNILNFCFCNELGNWDNNCNNDYSFEYCIQKVQEVINETTEENIEEKNLINNYTEVKENFTTEIPESTDTTDITAANTVIGEEIKDNGILLISEIQDKIFLPYTKEEVESILKKENYDNAQSVINDKFIKPFSEYKNLYGARVREIYKLLTEKEKYTKFEATEIVLELFKNKYLHPAIISACKTLDELDVYLDCLAKNELEDFKIFEIKYELYPIAVEEKGIVGKGHNKIQIFLNKIKSIFKRNKAAKDNSLNL